MIAIIEQFIINIALNFVNVETWNSFMRDPRNVAIMIGALVSLSGAWLGVFLLLRKLSLTADAISHTVLLGIVVAFFILLALGSEASLSSPLLLVGATGAGVLTVVLTEFVQRSHLVKSDAALGLVFPLLFAIAVILISRFAEDVHLDTDAVLVGEIGVAWANTNSYCLDNCADLIITPDNPRAEVGRNCTNCSRGGISPRDPEAIFEESCSNCGTYTAAEAWRERLIDAPPTLAFMPQALTIMALITLLNIAFVLVFYKELKLTSFDEQLAQSLGFRPVMMTYLLLTLVSLTAVGAFDAVGAILVVAFFVIPAATAYLLTDSLAGMLVISPLFGITGSAVGYRFASGNIFGVGTFNISISASMVIMTFALFLLVWVGSPRYGIVANLIRHFRNRQRFADQLLMGHLYNHASTPEEIAECALDTLHEHLNWTQTKVNTSLARTRLRGWVKVKDGLAILTATGADRVERFRRDHLARPFQNDTMGYIAIGD